jgi:hypothetical protein
MSKTIGNIFSNCYCLIEQMYNFDPHNATSKMKKARSHNVLKMLALQCTLEERSLLPLLLTINTKHYDGMQLEITI